MSFKQGQKEEGGGVVVVYVRDRCHTQQIVFPEKVGPSRKCGFATETHSWELLQARSLIELEKALRSAM